MDIGASSQTWIHQLDAIELTILKHGVRVKTKYLATLNLVFTLTLYLEFHAIVKVDDRMSKKDRLWSIAAAQVLLSNVFTSSME